MKKLTALLLALSLTLAFASCTSDQPAPSQAELAESYIAELRAIFDAAGITDPAPSSTFSFDESVDPPALESVELSYGQLGINGAFELASAAYAAVTAQYGEPNGEHAVPAYSIQGLIDLGSSPAAGETYFDWWTLGDRTLTLNISFSDARPSGFGITLTLEPLAERLEPLPAPPTAASYSP